MKRIEGKTSGAPAPAASYSQAVRIGDIVSVAGQTGVDPATRSLAPGGVGPETLRALRNARAALESCGATMDDVVRVDVVLSADSDFAIMNAVYSEAFQAPYPTRTTIVAGLIGGAHVEVTLLAVSREVEPS